MKKMILGTLVVLQGLAVTAQSFTPIFSATKPTIPEANINKFAINTSSENKAKWVAKGNKVQVVLGKFDESEWLNINVLPRFKSINNASQFQKVFLNINHKIRLNKDVFAEIEAIVSDKKNNRTVAFVPITDVLLNETKKSVQGSLLKDKFQANYPSLVNLYPPIVFEGKTEGDLEYDSYYTVHIAGTNSEKDMPKLALADIPNIKGFRFRLRKIDSKSLGGSSVWEIENIDSNYLVFEKVKNKNPHNNSGKSVNPSGLKRSTSKPPKSNTNNDDLEIGGENGGTCPKPFGH